MGREMPELFCITFGPGKALTQTLIDCTQAYKSFTKILGSEMGLY